MIYSRPSSSSPAVVRGYAGSAYSRVQIQPSKYVLDHADDTAPIRQHELAHTDHTDHTNQESICPK